MSSNTPALSAADRRILDNDAPGGLGGLRGTAKTGKRLDQLAKIEAGTLPFGAGATTASVQLDAALDGAPVLLSFNAAPGSAAKMYGTWNGTGQLTVTLDAAPGGSGTTVAYLVDARQASDLD